MIQTETTVTVARATTTTTLPLMPEATFEQATASLFQAWRSGDRAAAAAVALPEAVDAMFAVPAGPVQSRGCDTAEGEHDCAYRFGDQLLRLQVAQVPGGWVVAMVEFS
ncbi:MAG: hypothetical protein ACT4OM_03480 [Actinomycetota bacterium]